MHDVETMAYAGELPWHGLGIKVSEHQTPQEMQEAADLDWLVKKAPVKYKPEGADIPVHTGRYAIYRDTDGKFLDIVSEKWTPVQNHTAFEFFNDFVKSGDMTMETAGSLSGGRKVFALAKIKDGFSLANGDAVESYLLFTNPHIYGHSVDIRFTPIRVVCSNTLSCALNRKTDYKVRVLHSQKFNPVSVKEVLGLATQRLGDYKEQAELLSSKRYGNAEIVNFYKAVFPRTGENKENKLSRAAEKALAIVETQPGAEFAPGSYWNAYNAVSFLTDHKLGRTTDSRLTSAWYGVNRYRKAKALGLAVEYAKAA